MDMHPPPVIDEHKDYGFCSVSDSIRKARALWLKNCSEDVGCIKSTDSMLKYSVEKILCSFGTPVEEAVEMQRMHTTPDYRVELNNVSIRFIDEHNIEDMLKSSNGGPVLFYMQGKSSRRLALLAGLIAHSGFDVFAFPVTQNADSATSQIARICATYETGFVPALIYYDRNLKIRDTDLHIKGRLKDSKYFMDKKTIKEQYRRYISKIKDIIK